ncbi:MAG: hypothetical protein JJO71_26320 [Escherichia coli]|jgi:tetratricopeptide (TPR) repeat protein|uniref:hypothetical protein n=1 Tax=Segatella copri TaxID=165179 RepID=UPI0019331847|nr:hypothetical protein [Segatella copri]MBL1007154.1 hypothetical protein [Escherichia coli]MBM0129228.1 hypothetical protein [Segatella copri]MBV3428880.1 hypothetical protein [Segatella copri]
MDLNEMNPVLLVATLTQQVVELEKKLEADGEDAEIKAALSEHLLKRGNLLMQMGDKDGAQKDMQRYLQLNPEKIGELSGEFKAEGREHCR